MAQTIRAEMVASVHSIIMAKGDSVVVGDTLVILESMKMDTVVSTWDEVGGQRERENTIEIEIEIH